MKTDGYEFQDTFIVKVCRDCKSQSNVFSHHIYLIIHKPHILCFINDNNIIVVLYKYLM